LPDKKQPKILVIEDEYEWQQEISSILNRHQPCDIVMLGEYRQADDFVTSQDLDSFDAAIIDVRLRKQIYDQGGLAILDLVKQRRRDIPILILTAYSYDYPGLTAVTERYNRILTYDKEVFKTQPENILDALLVELPPEIGRNVSRRQYRASDHSLPSTDAESHGPLREVLTGCLVVGFFLVAIVLFLLISNRFPDHSTQLNVIFSLLVVALICVLLRIFKPDIVSQAIRLYKDLTSSSRTNKHQEKDTKKDIQT